MKYGISIIILLSHYLIVFSNSETDSLKVLLVANTSEDTIRVKILNQLAFELKDTNPIEAISLANQALKISQKLSWQEGEALAYNRIGLGNRALGNYYTAIAYYQENLKIRKKQNNSSGIANTNLNIGVAWKHLAKYDSALIYYYKALEIFENLNDKIGETRALNNIGIIQRLLGDFSKSIGTFNRTLSIFIELKDNISVAESYQNIGNCYFEGKDYIKARITLNKAIDLFKLENYKRGIADCYNTLVLIPPLKDNLEMGMAAYNLQSEVDHIDGLIVAMTNLSLIYISQKNKDSSEYYLAAAITLSKKSNSIGNLKDIYKANADLYEDEADYSMALKYFKMFHEIKDSIYTEDLQQLYVDIPIKYETEKKDQLLIIQNEQLKSKTLTNRFFLVVAVSLAILLIISSILFLQQRRLTRRKSQLAQQQIESLLNDQELKSINAMLEGQDNERKRIAEDLHDRVGSILSTVKLYFGSLNTKIDTYQDENKKQYDQANTLLDEAVQEVRRISHNLISGILMKFGLVPALKDLCDTVEGTQQLKINLKVFNVDERMDGQTEISIYRIIQELLSNVLKHAKATEVTISLTRNDGNLNIIVEDNGKGFDANMNYEGIGLKNIRSRVEKLNGQVKFDSVIDRGTTVIIDLPVDETPNDV